MSDRWRHLGLLIAAAAVIGASVVLYRAYPITGMLVGVSSGAVAVIVMAHLGVLAAVLAPFAILRRRSRGRKI